MPKLYCDLTELYAGSLGRRGFYGVARVVAEIAIELSQLSGEVQYVVFSGSLSRFIRIRLPDQQLLMGKPASSGLIIQRILIAIDRKISQFLMLVPHGLSIELRRVLRRMASLFIAGNKDSMASGIIFSAARPKFIATYAAALQEQELKLASLLHDFFPMLDRHDTPNKSFRESFIRDTRTVLMTSMLVTTNSHYTRNCLIKLQHIGSLPSHKHITVIQLAHECRCPQVEQGSRVSIQRSRRNEIGKSPFFLAIGCRPGRKNLQIILEAWKLLCISGDHPASRCEPPKLVLAGATKRSAARLLKQPRFAKIKEHVLFVESPTQAELVRLYKDARATLLLSFSEGWGLPAAESLWHGTPVLVSDTPIMHEVCGDLGVYIDPNKPKQLASWVEKLCKDKDIWAAQVKRIRESKHQLRRWKDTAQDMINTLNEESSK